jgi:hypothetical protein
VWDFRVIPSNGQATLSQLSRKAQVTCCASCILRDKLLWPTCHSVWPRVQPVCMLRIGRRAERGGGCNPGKPDGPGHGERDLAHECKPHPEAGGGYDVYESCRSCHGRKIQRLHRRDCKGGCRDQVDWPLVGLEPERSLHQMCGASGKSHHQGPIKHVGR